MTDHRQQKLQTTDTGQLALRCAQFFMSLGQSCLQFYHRYNKQKQRKTKLIKKIQKQKQKQLKKNEGQIQSLDDDPKKKIPKKPLTAYIIYFQQKKPNFVQKHPGLNLSQLTKLIAKQWKQIDNTQKKPYLAQAQQDRKRYQIQMKQFKIKYGNTISPQNQQPQPQPQQNCHNQIIQGNQDISPSIQPQNNQNQQIIKDQLPFLDKPLQLEQVQSQKLEIQKENHKIQDNQINDNNQNNQNNDLIEKNENNEKQDNNLLDANQQKLSPQKSQQ